jgi:hypothetical protein
MKAKPDPRLGVNPYDIVEEIDILRSDPSNSFMERVTAIDEHNAGITIRKIVENKRQVESRPS